VGPRCNVGYFSQDFAESIPKGYELVTWLHQFDPDATKEQIRGIMARCSSGARKATR